MDQYSDDISCSENSLNESDDDDQPELTVRERTRLKKNPKSLRRKSVSRE